MAFAVLIFSKGFGITLRNCCHLISQRITLIRLVLLYTGGSSPKSNKKATSKVERKYKSEETVCGVCFLVSSFEQNLNDF